MLKNAKTEYFNEHEEIATYLAIETFAVKVGDKATAQLAADPPRGGAHGQVPREPDQAAVERRGRRRGAGQAAQLESREKLESETGEPRQSENRETRQSESRQPSESEICRRQKSQPAEKSRQPFESESRQMTGSADFTPEEWNVVREGPTSAGMIVSTAQRGGSFREAFAMAKAYTEARKEHGDSELLDEIVSHKPDMDHAKAHSAEELKEHGLQRISEAVALVEPKASPAGARGLPPLRHLTGESRRRRQDRER